MFYFVENIRLPSDNAKQPAVKRRGNLRLGEVGEAHVDKRFLLGGFNLTAFNLANFTQQVVLLFKIQLQL